MAPGPAASSHGTTMNMSSTLLPSYRAPAPDPSWSVSPIASIPPTVTRHPPSCRVVAALAMKAVTRSWATSSLIHGNRGYGDCRGTATRHALPGTQGTAVR
jgi:hypothetical protein